MLVLELTPLTISDAYYCYPACHSSALTLARILFSRLICTKPVILATVESCEFIGKAQVDIPLSIPNPVRKPVS